MYWNELLHLQSVTKNAPTSSVQCIFSPLSFVSYIFSIPFFHIPVKFYFFSPNIPLNFRYCSLRSSTVAKRGIQMHFAPEFLAELLRSEQLSIFYQSPYYHLNFTSTVLFSETTVRLSERVPQRRSIPYSNP